MFRQAFGVGTALFLLAACGSTEPEQGIRFTTDAPLCGALSFVFFVDSVEVGRETLSNKVPSTIYPIQLGVHRIEARFPPPRADTYRSWTITNRGTPAVYDFTIDFYCS